MRVYAILCSLAAIGCDGFDPSGTYVGDVRRSGEASEVISLDPDGGGGRMSTTSFNAPASGVRVVVTRAGEHALDVQLGDFCRVRFEMSPVDEHSGIVSLDGEQHCPVREGSFDGMAGMTGTIAFGRDDPTGMTIDMTGGGSAGDPLAVGARNLTMSYSFDGARQP